MCGIAGIKSTQYNTKVDTKEVLFTLKHRGPDAQDYLRVNDNILFHTRLSIIDLDSRSNQPFTDYTGRYSIVFNGEIYNYKDLRESLDYPFITGSDTEVLLALLIIRGKNAIKQLDGMFAFAFFDNLSDTCILARDTFGEKPLYYSISNQTVFFASEIRTLLKLTQSKRTISKQQLSNWFAWQSIPGDDTLLDNIFQVTPGTFLEFGPDNSMTKTIFWNINDYRTQEFDNQKDILRNLESLIYSAVNKRLISDVPFASFLSGGIDSSIITMLASKSLPNKLETFTIGFSEHAFSEHIIARGLSKTFATNHHELILKPEYLIDNFDDYFNSMDTPTSDGMNSFVISKLTRESGFKMALSGLGGDEWFMGYPNMNMISKFNNISKLTSISNVFPFNNLKKYLPKKHIKFLNFLNAIERQGCNAYPMSRIYFDNLFIEEMLKLPRPNLFNNLGKEEISHSLISILEMEYYTIPVLLKDTDQYSMANNLEIRTPFMDRPLVEYLLGISNKEFPITKPKNLLRSIYEKQIPDIVFKNKKKGFTLPWEIWMRNQISEFCETTLKSFCDRIGNDKLLYDWKSFKNGKNNLLWSKWWGLVSIEQWLSRNDIQIK